MQFTSLKFANVEELAKARWPNGKQKMVAVKTDNMINVCTAV